MPELMAYYGLDGDNAPRYHGNYLGSAQDGGIRERFSGTGFPELVKKTMLACGAGAIGFGLGYLYGLPFGRAIEGGLMGSFCLGLTYLTD